MMQVSAGYQLLFGAWCAGVAIAVAIPVVIVATPIIMSGLAAAAAADTLAKAGGYGQN